MTDIDKLLGDWDRSVSQQYLLQVSRRDFFKTSLTAAASLLFSESVLASSDIPDTSVWKIFYALHNHLFPAGNNAPSADDFNATAYLRSILTWPGVSNEDKTFLQKGTDWLNDLAKKQFNNDFYRLSTEQKESTLQLVAKSQAGENWLSLVLLYLLEALLTDPVYGGNTNAVGWQWLEHQPGFPRPPADKRYFKL